MAVPPHTPVVLLAAVVASAVGFLAWVFRDTPGARPLAGFMFAASVWSLAEGMALSSPALAGIDVWRRIGWTAASLVPLAWLATVLAYAERSWRLTGRRAAALLVEPLLFAALVWTNGDHGLVWTDTATALLDGYVVVTREFGVVFWAHVSYSYLLVAVGAAVLVQSILDAERHFRNQYTALLGAVFAPLLANALSLSGVLPAQFDLTSVGFVVTGLVVTGAVAREDLLAVAPVTRELGREALVDDLADRVVILDDSDRVVDLNPAAERLFGVSTETAVGDPLAAVSEPLAESVAGVDAGQVDLELDGERGVRYYDARVSSLRGGYGAPDGRVVSLRDVTGQRRREQRLNVLNRLLRHNIRNEMNVVGGNAELLREDVADTPTAERRLDHIEETVETVVSRSEKVGRLARRVDDEAERRVELAPLVGEAAATVRERFPEATVDVTVPEAAVADCGPSLELAVEELLENAVEHNDGPEPAVEVSARGTGDGRVELRVADDGPGVPAHERRVIEAGRETALEHGSGVGLWLVAWTVREDGGTVDFRNREDGCTVSVRLPGEAPETAAAGDGQ